MQARHTEKTMRATISLRTLFILILAAAAACSPQAEERREPVVRPVKLVTVEEASNLFPLSYPAVIEAAQSSVITFQVRGLLQELPVNDGVEVAKGDLIAKLDQRDFQANFNSAKAQYDNAELEYRRAVRLVEENAVSRSVLDQRLSTRDVALAAYETAQKALEDSELRAPFDGEIAEVHVENFQNVGAQQPVVTLQTASALEAVIDVPADIVAYVPQVDPINTIVTLDAAPDVTIPAVIKEVALRADPTTQTYRARFSFTPPEDFLILPGMTGKVETTFVYRGDRDQLGVSVPNSAIVADGDGIYVWVVDEASMTVSKRAVTVSDERFGAEVAIIDGLQGGELIAAAGSAYLTEGMRVRAWDKNQ